MDPKQQSEDTSGYNSVQTCESLSSSIVHETGSFEGLLKSTCACEFIMVMVD